MKTVYDVLGVAPDADDRAIKAAFRNSAKVYHPDISGGDHSAEEQFKRITAAHSLIKSPERRAAYDRHLRLRRQQTWRQRKVTIAGCAISAVISAGLVGVIVPNFVKSVPRGLNANDSLLTKSPARQLEAIAGTTTEGVHTAGTTSIQIPSDTAVDGLRSAIATTAASSTEFDGTRAIETKTANPVEPGSIVVRPGNATTMLGGAAVSTAALVETALAGTAALAVRGNAAERSDNPSPDAPRADLLICMATRPAERQLPPSELATLRRRGNEFIANGVIAAARLVFQRAAEACDIDAAFALAATYDPTMLRKLGSRVLAPDIATARAWYEKAKKLGSVEASNQLELLAKAND
jgi:curved DNA-binding protein CbpA